MVDSLAAERVRALCEQLSVDQRDVLLMRLLGPLTIDEIAALMGRTRGSVKALQRRGLARDLPRDRAGGRTALSDPNDHVPEMPAVPLLDDATVDAILVGDRGPRGVDHLAAFAADVRATAERPPPRPSPELAALLAHGIPAPPPGRATRSPAAGHRRRPALATASGLGLAAKVGVATTAAVASLAGAAAAGVLPGDTDAPVRKVIELFTPVEFTDDGDPLDQGGNGTGADRVVARATPASPATTPTYPPTPTGVRNATTPTSPRRMVSGATTAPRPPTRSPKRNRRIGRSRRTRTPMTTRARTTSRTGPGTRPTPIASRPATGATTTTHRRRTPFPPARRRARMGCDLPARSPRRRGGAGRRPPGSGGRAVGVPLRRRPRRPPRAAGGAARRAHPGRGRGGRAGGRGRAGARRHDRSPVLRLRRRGRSRRGHRGRRAGHRLGPTRLQPDDIAGSGRGGGHRRRLAEGPARPARRPPRRAS